MNPTLRNDGLPKDITELQLATLSSSLSSSIACLLFDFYRLCPMRLFTIFVFLGKH